MLIGGWGAGNQTSRCASLYSTLANASTDKQLPARRITTKRRFKGFSMLEPSRVARLGKIQFGFPKCGPDIVACSEIRWENGAHDLGVIVNQGGALYRREQ